MTGAMRALVERRRALIRRSAWQREAIARAAQPYTEKLSAVDRVVRAIREHPVIAALATAAIGLLGPRRLIGYAARAAGAWSLLKRL